MTTRNFKSNRQVIRNSFIGPAKESSIDSYSAVTFFHQHPIQSHVSLTLHSSLQLTRYSPLRKPRSMQQSLYTNRIAEKRHLWTWKVTGYVAMNNWVGKNNESHFSSNWISVGQYIDKTVISICFYMQY